MEEDWQDAAFGSRHMHNRVQNRLSRKHRPFDVHKTFGSYACKCAAWQDRHDGQKSDKDITLELYRLSPNGEGIIGEIRFPHALEAAVVLSGSRASLKATVKEIEADILREDGGGGSCEHLDRHEKETSDEDESVSQDSGEEPTRFQRFEKNSFREPKFWIRWNGMIEGSEEARSDLGYLVFSGSDCQKFKGTITCGPLGWKDVAITGRKVSGRGASDVPISWMAL